MYPHSLKPYLIRFLLPLLFVLPSAKTFASHIVGADMFYTWVSGDTYKITVILYADCGPASSAAFSTLPLGAPQVCVFNGNTPVATLSLPIQAPSAGIEITPVCPPEIGMTQCTNASYTIPGIKKFVYSTLYTVPSASNVWRFVFNSMYSTWGAGRAAAITNINSPGSTNIQLIDTLNNLTAPNSNPLMTIIPTPFYCVNSYDSYNPGAVDADGDVLQFMLVAATNGTTVCTAVGSSVSYTTAFPAWPGQPITPTTPLQCTAASWSFDPATGQINFYPNYLQRSVVVYNIREFRGGVLVGTCQREMTFLVRSCTNIPPSGIYNSASAGLITDSTHFRLCSGMGAFSILMNPTDTDPTNNITVSAFSLPAGATFTTVGNGTPTPHSTFSWSTTGVPPGTYVFYVTFTDDNCPEISSLTRAFTVTIDPPPTPITGTLSLCIGATSALANATPGGTWSISPTSVASVSPTGVVTGIASGTAIISYNLPGGCVASNIVTVDPPPVGPIAGPATLCIGSTITLTNPVSGGTWSSSGSAGSISSSGVVTGSSAGTVTVTYTNTGLCGTLSATSVITVSAPPAPPTITGPTTVCEAATITLTGSPAGGTWTSTSGAAITSGGIVTGSTPGTATITYTIPSACGEVPSTKIITINPLPVAATISGAGPVCSGSTITLSASISGGTWTATPSATATITSAGVVTGGGVAGTATISYTLTNSCGTVSSIAVVTVNPLPVAGTISGPSTVCVGADITLSASVAGGTWSTASTTVTLSATGVVTGGAAGTALISYTVTNSCGSAYATKIITINPLPVAGTISGPGVVCQGSTIALSSSATGGTWSSVPASVATISSSGTVTGVSGGTATISYTVTNSCGTAYATSIVTVNPLPTVAPITGPSSVCVPLTITLACTTTGGIWSSSSGTATVSPTGVVTGVSGGTTIISYSVTNSCGTVVATKPVTVNLFPDAGTISGPTQVCTGNTITLTSTVGGGTWTGGAPAASISSGGVVTGLVAGVANFSYTVVNGCGPASANYTVTVNPTPDSGTIAGPTNVCQGSTITLTETSPGGVWSSSSANATVSLSGVVLGVTPGTATIHYTITAGPCTAHTSVVITVDILPDAGVISGPTSLCATTSMLMTESVTGGTWSCSPGASISAGGLLTGLTPGTATVSYSVTNSCGTDVATMIVTVNVMPDAGTITGPDRVCVGSAITLTDLAPGGVWTSSTPSIASITSAGLVNGIMGGTTTISYTVSNPYCTAYATKIVTVDPIAVPGTIIGDPYMCMGTIDTLTSTVAGGTWSFTGTAATVSSTGVITAISAGMITVTYTVTNICGPKFTTKVITINSLPDPGTIAGPHKVCIGGTISLSDPTPTYGTWSSSNTTVATISATGEVTTIAAGTTTISYVTTASTGCSNYATHIVTVFPMPDPGIISGPSVVCTLAHIQMHETVSGGTWSSSNSIIAPIDSTGLITTTTVGTATITYTTAANAGGCISQTVYPLTIVLVAPFTINETIDNVHCYGAADGSITVSASSGTGPWSYAWNNGASSATVNGLAPGQFTVELTDLSTGCHRSKLFDIKGPDSIVIFPAVTNDVCYLGNGKISVSAAGGTAPYIYSWATGSVSASIADLMPGIYIVKVTDANNCYRQRAIDVLEDECSDVNVHDGMSPNGDGINEYWIIDGIQYYRNSLVQLFDKWGDKVYEQRGYDNRWNGRGTNGSPLPDGTYFYVVKLNSENTANGKNVLTGSLLIKR